MSDIADDAVSVAEMIQEAAQRLHAKDPKHELLGYLQNMDDDGVYAAFVERFGKKDIPECKRSSIAHTTWMHAQYLVALRVALGEVPVAALVEARPGNVPPCHPDHDDESMPF